MSRGNYKFIRDNSHFTENIEELPDWLKAFADKMAEQEGNAPTALDQSRARDAQASMFDYVNNLINNKPRFATVNDKVMDLQERTGLKAYLNKISSPSIKNIATMINSASYEGDNLMSDFGYPKLFDDYPEIKYYIDNTVKTKHGNIHVPAVINSIIEIYKNKGVTPSDLRDDDLLSYINNVIAKEQSDNKPKIQTDIGSGVGLNHDSNEDDGDAFGFATPAS